MKNILNVVLVSGCLLSLALVFGGWRIAEGCDAGQSCANDATWVEVTGCSNCGSYCCQTRQWHTTSCSGEPSCQTYADRYTGCGSVAAGCPKTGYDKYVDCCEDPPPPTNTPRPPPCSCEDWTDGACGDGANGCDWGYRNQTRSCSPGDCDDEQQCDEDASCPIPAVVQGYKIVEPGDVTTNPNMTAIPVTLGGPDVTGGSPATTNPFTISFDTSQGTVRNLTVPAVPPAGYLLIGYDLCYDDITCHSWLTAIPGNSMPISDDLVLSNFGAGDPYRYADVRWYYCTIQAGPATVTASPDCNLVTVTWSAAAGATSYDVYRNPGPVLVAANATSPATVVAACGINYTYFVRAHNGCDSGDSGNTAPVAASCIPGAPTNVTAVCGPGGNSINVAWTDVSFLESRYDLRRGPDIPGEPVALPANSTTYTDNAPPNPPQAFQYSVQAVNACGSSSEVFSPVYPSCINYDDWFQAGGGGDVTAAGGNLGTSMPVGGLPAYFILNPSWNPAPTGMPMAFGDEDPAAWGGNLSSSNVSTAGTLVNISLGSSPNRNWSAWVTKTENKYVTIRDRVMSRFGAQEISGGEVTEENLTNYIAAAIGNGHQIIFPGFGVAGANLTVAVLHAGDAGGITLRQAVVGAANTGVIIFADGPVVIAGRLTPPNPESSFLAVVTGENMTVNFPSTLITPTPAVVPYQFDIANDAYPAELVGIFYTEKVFSTGAAPAQLKIYGSVAGMAGVTMGRSSEGPYPAEFVKFNPRLTAIMFEIGLRRKVHFEQSIP